MAVLPIAIPATLLLAGLLFFERRRSTAGKLATKAPLSCLFVLAALLAPHWAGWYYRLIVAGLVLGLVGDVCLALPGRKAFMAGLASFLLGHVLYVAAFATLARPGLATWVGAAVVLAASAGVYLWLRPHLGSMNVPVVAYVLVISVMLGAAWSVLADTDLPLAGRAAIFAGALLFYVSDVSVARDRFVREEFANRLVGLPVYYAGQFILAFSPALLG